MQLCCQLNPNASILPVNQLNLYAAVFQLHHKAALLQSKFYYRFAVS
jgi:hypothetical protein